MVTYASKYGATKDIVEKVGQVIRQTWFQVDILPVKDVHDLTPYEEAIENWKVHQLPRIKKTT